MTRASDAARPRTSVLAAHVEGEAVLLEMDRKRYYRLNETGQAIWRALEAGDTKDRVVERMTEVYDVAPDDAAAAFDAFVAELAAQRLVESPET